ncbi:starch synthase [Chromatiales bacterium (ex Bugula neritina AB1)]|nr:starch synthase [Chromatiales bacterium (ex Bugula neritina AB1)]
MRKKHNILFACSELTPWVKTGGLADVCGSLPQALHRAGNDVRVVIPGYESVLRQIDSPVFISQLELPLGNVALCQTRLRAHDVLLITHPSFSNRPGNPYMSDDDRAWADNPYRFALFSQAVTEIALDRAQLEWQPDIVHCNDWQTGLVPALLTLHKPRPATVFTVHNLAYQGNILHSAYTDLQLPAELFHANGLEFWGQASYIKGGLAYADRVNTVSAGYAAEIRQNKYGCGMDGLLRSRGDRVSGILNGIDMDDWNPQTDPHLPQNYSLQTLDRKSANKAALQKEMRLPQDPEVPVFGVISRLAEQKGIDLIINAISTLRTEQLQLVVLGSGDTELQTQLLALQQDLPDKVAVKIGFSEPFSRLIEAGADSFLMPSRYEPCGLNQMYSLRYGTPPVVTHVGGLADTVFDPDQGAEKANGFVIKNATSEYLAQGIQRVLTAFANKPLWHQLQHNGMTTDFSWDESAQKYETLYHCAINDIEANLTR